MSLADVNNYAFGHQLPDVGKNGFFVVFIFLNFFCIVIHGYLDLIMYRMHLFAHHPLPSTHLTRSMHCLQR